MEALFNNLTLCHEQATLATSLILTVVSRPSVINIKKKITAHRLDSLRLLIASGYTINISPTSVIEIDTLRQKQ